MNTEHAVHVERLCKTFGPTTALDELDLAVPRGTVFGLLGRNGAGKTTLMRVIMGLLRPDRGEALVFGEDMRRAPIDLRARVAYVPQEVSLIARLDLARHADLLGHFYPRFDVDAARSLARRLDVDWDLAAGALSVGSRRKAAVVLALASGADLVVLDEPAAGLDPLARRALYELLIERLGEGGELTVLLSTHLVHDLERLADRVAILDAGRTLRVDDVEGFARSLVRLQVVFPDDVPRDFEIPGAETTRREGCVAVGVVDVVRAGGRLAELEARRDLRVTRFALGLEDVFVELVGPREDSLTEVAS
ncbi:MAG: ABC transporter ATP-binding protein [Planctomycetes bacterium]|nr:ABC transporter ATP-binding protein [Planctomycetota bacterium]